MRRSYYLPEIDVNVNLHDNQYVFMKFRHRPAENEPAGIATINGRPV